MTLHSDYLEDAKSHISLAAKHIKVDMTGAERFQAVLLVAIGVEKLLKHIIASVNPALILKSQDFDSVVVACHIDKVTATEKTAELEKKASLDVITLKASIQRAALFCDGVKQNSQLIHALADMRDIAAHRCTNEIDEERAKTLLCRDLFPAINEISKFSGLTAQDFFQDQHSRLDRLSSDISSQDNFNAQMIALLEKHRATWEKRAENKMTVANADKITDIYLTRRSDTTECPCPACGNRAVATLEPDFDYDYDPIEGTSSAYVTGVYVTEIHCLYCALRLDQYDQLNFVDADALLAGDEQV